MNSYLYKGFTINVFDDSNHRFGSNENSHHYSKYYFGNAKNIFPVSRHGIAIYKREQLQNSCMVIGFASNTFAGEKSFIQQDDNLLVCCCNMVFCLSLPDLELLWKEELDNEVCFQIQKFENDFLVLGKNNISCIEKSGKIKWQYQSLVPHEQYAFLNVHKEIREIKIMLVNDEEYCLNFNGEIAKHSKKERNKT